MKIFVSYHHADSEVVEQIVRLLVEVGYEVLWDRDFPNGASFVGEIDKALAAQDVVVLGVLSPDYLEGRWSRLEWQTALKREVEEDSRRLMLVRVRDCRLEGLLSTKLHVDLVGKAPLLAAEKLLAGLRTFLEDRESIAFASLPRAGDADRALTLQWEHVKARLASDRPTQPAEKNFPAEPFTNRRARRSNSRAALLVALLGAVVLGGLTAQLGRLLPRSQGNPGVWPNAQVLSLTPSGSVRGVEREPTFFSIKTAPTTLQILPPWVSRSSSFCYRLTRDAAEPISVGCGLIRDQSGVLSLALAPEVLKSGVYRLELWEKADPYSPLESYLFRVREAQ